MPVWITLNELSRSLELHVLQNMHRIIFANVKCSCVENIGCPCSK